MVATNEIKNNRVKDEYWILRFLKQRETMLFIFVVLFVIIASFLSEYFLTLYNFEQILIGIALDAIVGIGMTILLVGGGIDLSVGSIIGFSAAIVGQSFLVGNSIPITILYAILGGLFIGAINGSLIAFVNINPIIATLAMMQIARSGAFIISQGFAFSAIPEEFLAISGGDIFGIPNLVIISIVCAIIFAYLLANNITLRKYFYIGGNEAGAFRAGINIERFKFFGYVITGFFASIAAILLVSRMGSTFPHSGTLTEFRVLSGALIGGASLGGGKGSIIGTFLGLLLLGLVNNILVLAGISVYWQGIAVGVILVLAVASDALMTRRKF
jgi:ribose transport system permease protein